MVVMQARYVDGLTIRPLRDGDTGTVSTLFGRLGSGSRERRFCGAKPRLSDPELARLARVDGRHHVLVGYVAGDPEPVGMARLVRDGSRAEIALRGGRRPLTRFSVSPASSHATRGRRGSRRSSRRCAATTRASRS
jgi:hypothetical protein